MTTLNHPDANTFAAGAAAVRAKGRSNHPWRGARPARPVETYADMPASELFWLIETLVLGESRNDARQAFEDPRFRTRRLRTAVPR